MEPGKGSMGVFQILSLIYLFVERPRIRVKSNLLGRESAQETICLVDEYDFPGNGYDDERPERNIFFFTIGHIRIADLFKRPNMGKYFFFDPFKLVSKLTASELRFEIGKCLPNLSKSFDSVTGTVF